VIYQVHNVGSAEMPNWPSYSGRFAPYKQLAEAALADARRLKSRVFRIAVARRTTGILTSRGSSRDVALAGADPLGVVIIWRTVLYTEKLKPNNRTVVAHLIPAGADYFDRRIKGGERRKKAHQALITEFEARLSGIDLVSRLAELDE